MPFTPIASFTEGTWGSGTWGEEGWGSPPTSLGLVTLTISTPNGTDPVTGSVAVQVLDAEGNEYQVETLDFPSTVNSTCKDLADQLLAAVRSEAQTEILG